MERDVLGAIIGSERQAIAEDLRHLTDEDWIQESLCAGWSVEDVVAHLGSAMTIGAAGWIRSIVRAGFRPAVHNRRQLERFRGSTPQDTLRRFAALGSAGGEPVRMPTRNPVPWLGEIVVHGEDIRRPLGIEHTYSDVGLTRVAEFFAGRDYAVNSRSQIKGLRLRATDAAFAANDDPALPLVEGPLLGLVMVMAGRGAYLRGLAGAGVPELARRLGGDRARPQREGRGPGSAA
ncbi:maleylpyruvate isomerase family mycothiol-dependent enzyme [Myceligenerans pegani]|uniref:Maleylpyruvate isomerase family mycothiol-dependent enzyme n=1 Tax=Myceligenerans pegani TaxID=2776917 RepID=A0ABR9N3H1_9MICO|nr:maleylpyruvate isomerase family mycothiol-dependent enzyme [Myceligenerans sp. TRM 65318]MBE1878205.1 maleylpyruvate isomerase family mycothiol-dependent enzyme [Myceligenerans sp. TRM 65318]MBE3020476.1 maleylpyruvate isomerase family mycothiol-dependent enzyme [Myceligenerans sp. TRM 65318]